MLDIEQIKRVEKLMSQLKALKATLMSEKKAENATSLAVSESSSENSSFVKTADFDQLKTLLDSPSWPHAVDEDLICDEDSETDKEYRAEGMLNLIIEESVKDKKFLDLGCGEGHVVIQAAKIANISVGFDIQTSGVFDWELQNNKMLLTTNWDKVIENGPYDVILIYDVVDHINNQQERIDLLTKAKEVKTNNGKIYLRTHPFCSRHGGHLYRTLNKAYAHLVFTPQELESLGHPLQEKFYNAIHPRINYDSLFKSAGLQKISDSISFDPIEPFFIKTPKISARIKRHWQNSHDVPLKTGKDFPKYQTDMSFIDFVLK